MTRKNKTAFINGMRHDLTLLAVREFDKDGRPLMLQRIREEQIVKLSEDGSENVFITAFIPRSSLNCDYRKYKG